MNAPVRELMSTPAITLEADRTVAEALTLMRRHGIRHLPITRAGELVGLLSERDIFRMLCSSGTAAETERVEEAMSDMPYAVRPEDPITTVARYMSSSRYGCAVVEEEGRVVGVVTTVDALRMLARVLETH